MFRFAPSPTGDMQLEDLRVALYNFICAKQKGDRFIVRIEDIDKAENTKEKDKEILNLLDIFGITYDKVYHQSSNFKYHLQFASTLLDKKIQYTHLPAILINQKKKTNKADDENSVQALLNKGYMPKAIINYLIGLGSKTPKEIFTLDEALKWFDINNMSKSATRFGHRKIKIFKQRTYKITWESIIGTFIFSNKKLS